MSDYADKIAEGLPLPPAWQEGVVLTEALVDMIVSYGASCAREGYNLASGVKS